MEILSTQNINGIDEDLLLQYGAVYKKYKKDEFVFIEGHKPQFFYQLLEGKIKMVSEAPKGKEFIQGFFEPGQSFGEPPVFEGGEYPASAIAVEPSIVIRLSIPSFVQLLKENFSIHWNFTKLLAKRLKGKANALKVLSSDSPEDRILALLGNLKRESKSSIGTGRVKINYTRQQVADMTGLRVETAIRVMRNLYSKGVLIIEKGKVFY